MTERANERNYPWFTLFSAVLNDKTMRKIAMKYGAKRTDLGYMLDLESTDVEQIQCKHSDPTDQAFYILLVSLQWLLRLPKASSYALRKAYELGIKYCCIMQCISYSNIVIWWFQTWREMTGDKTEKEQVDMLENALREIGRNDLRQLIGR